jgi:hypothetical protein
MILRADSSVVPQALLSAEDAPVGHLALLNDVPSVVISPILAPVLCTTVLSPTGSVNEDAHLPHVDADLPDRLENRPSYVRGRAPHLVSGNLLSLSST